MYVPVLRRSLAG